MVTYETDYRKALAAHLFIARCRTDRNAIGTEAVSACRASAGGRFQAAGRSRDPQDF